MSYHLKPRRWRSWLAKAYGRKCTYCEKQDALTWDHLLPRAMGGTNTSANLVRACEECNINKGAKTLEEWLAKRPDLDGGAIAARIKKAQKDFHRRVGIRKLMKRLTIKLGDLVEGKA